MGITFVDFIVGPSSLKRKNTCSRITRRITFNWWSIAYLLTYDIYKSFSLTYSWNFKIISRNTWRITSGLPPPKKIAKCYNTGYGSGLSTCRRRGSWNSCPSASPPVATFPANGANLSPLPVDPRTSPKRRICGHSQCHQHITIDVHFSTHLYSQHAD